MKSDKILILDRNYEYNQFAYLEFFKAGFLVDYTDNVTAFLKNVKKIKYCYYIVDIIALPGEGPEWIELDKKKRDENPGKDSFLGLEMLRLLFDRENEKIKAETITPQNILIFTGVDSQDDKILSLGISKEQILKRPFRNYDPLEIFMTELLKNELIFNIVKEKLGNKEIT